MFQLFGLFGSFLSASSAIKEGKERRRQYEQEAKELELERTQTEIKGLESHNLRLAAFDEANNMNSALFGFANRDETADRSIRALTRASAESKRKGFAAEQAARTKAMSTLFSGINNYSKVS